MQANSSIQAVPALLAVLPPWDPWPYCPDAAAPGLHSIRIWPARLTVLSSGPSTFLLGSACALGPSVNSVTRRPAAQAKALPPGATVRWLTLCPRRVLHGGGGRPGCRPGGRLKQGLGAMPPRQAPAGQLTASLLLRLLPAGQGCAARRRAPPVRPFGVHPQLVQTGGARHVPQPRRTILPHADQAVAGKEGQAVGAAAVPRECVGRTAAAHLQDCGQRGPGWPLSNASKPGWRLSSCRAQGQCECCTPGSSS